MKIFALIFPVKVKSQFLPLGPIGPGFPENPIFPKGPGGPGGPGSPTGPGCPFCPGNRILIKTIYNIKQKDFKLIFINMYVFYIF